MARFIKHLLCFFAFFSFVIVGGIFLPATPRASTAHLFAKTDKDSLLENTPSPRIILLGGSNISMSINSQLLMDSLQFFPVNTGLSASIGLQYMLDNSLPHIRPGDIVVVSPEYSQFFGDLEIGTEDLIRVVLDKNPSDIFLLRKAQLLNSLQYIPKYALGKFKLMDYLVSADTLQVYRRMSFNRYGDMNTHWRLGGQTFPPLTFIDPDSFNESVLVHLNDYMNTVLQRGANFCITFPAVDEVSFKNQREAIETVMSKLASYGFKIVGMHVRYIMPNHYMFDTPYHLIQPGVNYRTLLLIEDLKPLMYDDVEVYVEVSVPSSSSAGTRVEYSSQHDNGLAP